MLPRINKRWARVLRGPSDAWQVVSLGSIFNDHARPVRLRQTADRLPNAEAAFAWFRRRPG